MDTAKPFLWGPVKSALLQQARQADGRALLLRFCYTTDQRVKEMMVDVLTDLGRDRLKDVQEILPRLLPLTAQPGSTQIVWQLIRRVTVEDAIPVRNAKKIAVEVAGNLGLQEVLERAALQPDSNVRTAAVRYTYYLWQRDREAGFVVLDAIARETIRTALPNPAGFESVLGLSLILLFDQPHDGEVLKRLQQAWQLILAKALGIREKGSNVGQFLREVRREQFFSVVITLLLRILHQFPPYNPANYEDLAAFFTHGPDEKELYRRICRYLDVSGDYSMEQLERDSMAVISCRNYLLEGTMELAFATHAAHTPFEFLPFLKRYFDAALADPVPGPYVALVPFVLEHVLHLNPRLDPVYEAYVQQCNICIDYYSKLTSLPGLQRKTHPPEASIAHLSLIQYWRTGHLDLEWLAGRLDPPLARNDVDFFAYLVNAELHILGIEQRQPRLALDVVGFFFDRMSPELTPLIEAFLARLRLSSPDLVDDFLEEHEASNDMRLRIRTNEPVEEIGALIGQRSYELLLDVLENSPEMRERLIRIFQHAADCKNIRQWLDYALRDLINVVYGGEALRQAR